MKRIIENKMARLILVAGAAATFGCAYVRANTISTTVHVDPQPTQNTGSRSALLNINCPAVTCAEGLTDYGINKAYASSGSSSLFTSASSVWGFDFTLAGGTAGANVTLGIQYSIDATLALRPGSDYAHFLYTLEGSSHVDRVIAGMVGTTFSSGGNDNCPSRGPGPYADGFCQGAYSSSGTVTVTNLFTIGNNTLMSSLEAETDNGSADAFSTARVLGIIVPNGITWSYSPDITGNPLNFQNPGAAPEPATLGMIGAGLVALGLLRKRVLSSNR